MYIHVFIYIYIYFFFLHIWTYIYMHDHSTGQSPAPWIPWWRRGDLAGQRTEGHVQEGWSECTVSGAGPKRFHRVW